MFITREQIIEFINNQPDNRKVDMEEASNTGRCGCLLIHLFKHYFPEDNGACFAGTMHVKSGKNSMKTPDMSIFIDSGADSYRELKKVARRWA